MRTVWIAPELHSPRASFRDFRRAFFAPVVEASSEAAKAAGIGLSGAATAGISIAALAAEMAIQQLVGQGRKAADKWVQSGTGQNAFLDDILDPASVIAQSDPEKAADLVSQAWKNYLVSASGYAAKGANQAKVIKQNLTTPAFMQTVGTLLGKNPLDSSYTAAFSGAGGTQTALGNMLPSILPVVAGIVGQVLHGPLPATRIQGPQTTDDGNDPQGGINTGSVGQPVDGAGAPPEIGPPTTTLPQATNIPGGLSTEPSVAPPVAAPGVIPPSLLSRVLPQVISGGTSLLTGVLGANAANNAAATQSQAALEAAKLNTQAGQNAIDFNKEALAQQQKNAQPWIDAGAGALKSIGEITSTPYTLPTAEEARNTPGYQFALEQGQKALEAYERANGTLMSGKAAKDIFNYGIGSADTNYQNVVNNSLKAREANLNPLLSEAGLGQVSTSGVNSNLSTGANNNTNIGLTTAQNVGNLQQQSAQARASGYSTAQSNLLNGFRSVANILTGVFSPAAA